MKRAPAMLAVTLALELEGCFLPDQPPAPTPGPRPVAAVPAEDRPAIAPGAGRFAEEMYRFGSASDDTEVGRAAFRQVCLAHEVERQMVLDAMYRHAQEYVAMRRTWYQEHCSGDGYAIVDPDTGAVHDGVVCDPAAGPPPARMYPRTHDEMIAQRQRDACRAAQ